MWRRCAASRARWWTSSIELFAIAVGLFAIAVGLFAVAVAYFFTGFSGIVKK